MNMHTVDGPTRTVVGATAAALATIGLIVGLVASSGPALPASLPERVAEPHWASERTELDHRRVDVPLAIEGDVPIVHGWIDGHGPYRFLVDTGCSHAVLVDDDLAERLALPVVGTVDNSDGAGRVALLDLASLGELDLGGARFVGTQAVVDDLSNVEVGGDYDGLLGFPLFAELLASIDYRRATLSLERGALDPADPHVAPFVDWYGVPHVPVTIGEQTLQVLVDTGSPLSLILPWTTRERFGFDGDLHRAGTVLTIYSELDWWRARLAERCTVAGHEWQGLDAHFFDPSTESALGGALLRDRTVVLDTANGLVAIR